MNDTDSAPAKRGAFDERRARRRELAFVIRSAVAASGMKQRRIAEMVGIHESALSRILRGDRGIEPDELEKLKEILGIQLSDKDNFDVTAVPAVIEARRGFARRLRKRREELNWPQSQVAMGITDLTSYAELEDAERSPEVFELLSLPGRLGVSMVWLVQGLPTAGDPSYS